MTFGIQPSSIPFNEKGEFPVNRHLEWIQHRQVTELATKQAKEQCQLGKLSRENVKHVALMKSETSITDHIDTAQISPKPQDVLFGTGISHPGNDYFRHLIASQMDCYNNAVSNFDKTLLSLQVISQVKESGGRFLKLSAKNWYIAKDEEARKKVASTFRNQRKVIVRRNLQEPLCTDGENVNKILHPWARESGDSSMDSGSSSSCTSPDSKSMKQTANEPM